MRVCMLRRVRVREGMSSSDSEIILRKECMEERNTHISTHQDINSLSSAIFSILNICNSQYFFCQFICTVNEKCSLSCQLGSIEFKLDSQI